MAKKTVVGTVADAIVRAEIAVVRAGRKAVGAVQRQVDARQQEEGSEESHQESGVQDQARRCQGGKKVAKKATKRARRR